MKLDEVRNFLSGNVRKDAAIYYGEGDQAWLDQVVSHWFDDGRNYDERWPVILKKISKVGRVLDMAAGCGTFVLFSLRQGYQVWGIEPEEWKREYFKRKIAASHYPSNYLDHVIPGVGEALPFCDEVFDLVTSYQTLEHVQDVRCCLMEMLRVLKPGGVLYLKAPDYNSFYEPHYRLPFLPSMNKKLASFYLKLLGRPVLGLKSLQWITKKGVIRILQDCPYEIDIEGTGCQDGSGRTEKKTDKLPRFLRTFTAPRMLSYVYHWKSGIKNLLKAGREEKVIDLWITKKI